MGKSFNDRNRKKGAERAYRKTKRSDKGKRGGWDRGEGHGADPRSQGTSLPRDSQPTTQNWD